MNVSTFETNEENGQNRPKVYICKEIIEFYQNCENY